MAIVLRQDCCPCIGDGEGRSPCGKKLRIDYLWGGCSDLDTHTEYDGEGVGWACDGGGNRVQWVSGDDTSCNGQESVEIELTQSEQTQYVYCSCGWFYGARDEENPCPGTGCPVTIRVTSCNDTQSKTISTGFVSTSCASGNTVAVIECYADGTFLLR